MKMFIIVLISLMLTSCEGPDFESIGCVNQIRYGHYYRIDSLWYNTKNKNFQNLITISVNNGQVIKISGQLDFFREIESIEILNRKCNNIMYNKF